MWIYTATHVFFVTDNHSVSFTLAQFVEIEFRYLETFEELFGPY